MVDDIRNVPAIGAPYTQIASLERRRWLYRQSTIHTLTYQISLSLSHFSSALRTNARSHDYHPHIMTSSFLLIAPHLHLRLRLHYNASVALPSKSLISLCAIRLYLIIFFFFRFCTFVPLVAHLHYQLAYGAWTNGLSIWGRSHRVLFGLVGCILDWRANDCAIASSIFPFLMILYSWHSLSHCIGLL